MTSGDVCDELAEAGLRLAQLALEAVAFAHVADGAVGAGEPAVLAEPGRGDELGRDGLAVRALDVDPAADLLRSRGHAGREVVLGDVARRAVDQRPEVLAEELVGLPAGQPLDRVRQEGEAALAVDRPDEVRRVLDEIAVALLRARRDG